MSLSKSQLYRQAFDAALAFDAQTEHGRRAVAMMIRTYPDPGGLPGLTVPRAKMFKALGLPETE